VSVPVGVKFSGKITVTAAGSLRSATAVSSAKSFKVPPKLGFKLTGSYATRGGVQRFHQSADVKAWIVFSPDRTLTADYQLQAWQNGKWITADGDLFVDRVEHCLPVRRCGPSRGQVPIRRDVQRGRVQQQGSEGDLEVVHDRLTAG